MSIELEYWNVSVGMWISKLECELEYENMD